MASTSFESHWLGVKGIFGGYVLGRIVDEADWVDGFRPQALSLTFFSAVQPGAVKMSVETLHRGRSTVSLRLELSQGGRVRVHAIASLVPIGQVVTWSRRADPTTWGDPESAPVLVSPHRTLSYGDHLDVRKVGVDTLEAGAMAWVRMTAAPAEHGNLGPHGIASVLLDVLPPGLFALAEPPAFVPTVDFTVHFSTCLAGLQDDWFLVRNRTVWATRDFCVDESELHARDGRVLAQVRQGRAIRWS